MNDTNQDLDVQILSLFNDKSYEQIMALYTGVIKNEQSDMIMLMDDHICNFLDNQYSNDDDFKGMAKYLIKIIGGNKFKKFTEAIDRIATLCATKLKRNLLDVMIMSLHQTKNEDIYNCLKNIWSYQGFRLLAIKYETKILRKILSSPLFIYYTNNVLTVTQQADILSIFLDDTITSNYVIKTLFKILKFLEIFYKRMDMIGSLTSNITINYRLMNLMLTLWKSRINNVPNDYQEITDYKIAHTKSQWRKLAVCAFYSIRIYYLSLFQINKYIKERKNTMFIALFDGFTDIRQLEKIGNEIKIILNDQTITNDIFDTYILMFSKFNIFYSNEIVQDYINMVTNVYVYNENEKIDDNYLQYISNVIEGFDGKLNNPHIRYNAMQLLISLIDEYGFAKFENLLKSFSIYLKEVKFFDWTDPIDASLHYRRIVDFITMLADIDKYQSDILTVDLCYRLLNIASDIIKIHDEILEKIKTIHQQYAFNQTVSLFRKEAYELLDSVKASLCAFKLFSIGRPELISLDVAMKFVMMGTILLECYSNGAHPIYTVCQITDTPIAIMYIILESMLILLQNGLIGSDKINFDLLKRVVKTIKFPHTNELLSYETNSNTIEYPEEFVDQLFMTPIENPIMIPNTNGVFEKVSMVMLLRSNPSNPFTREPLTPETLEEYNNKPEIKQQLTDFMERLNNWKEKNI